MNARGNSGQASVEVVAIVPVVLLGSLLLFQALAIGYTVTVVDGAAASGAIALADGRSAKEAVSRSLPGWASARASVRESRGAVEVSLNPPSVVPGLGGLFEFSSTAAVASG